jgi:ABC-type multidrug transport system fused ATPase/permease subunit
MFEITKPIINGSISYHGQQPWILTASIEENIKLGLDCGKNRFEQIISNCELQPDLLLMPNGIETKIGEQGVNLSGGQKTRISLGKS